MAPDTAADPLPDDWEARDSHDCFYEYVRMCRDAWQSGNREIPLMFLPSRERAE